MELNNNTNSVNNSSSTLICDVFSQISNKQNKYEVYIIYYTLHYNIILYCVCYIDYYS
jgi:hypothetical protein